MTSVFCPFCNAALIPDHLQRAEAAKVACPRCGEPLPAHLIKEMPASSPIPQITPVRTPGWTNRKIGLAIFAAMVLMALGSLILALVTWEGRRKNDFRANRVTVPPSTVQAPAELVGLGYLPAEVNVVAALQVTELLKDDSGKKLFEAPRPGLLDLLLNTVEKWTRLKAGDIDHIVLGTEIKDKPPQITVIVQTRKAIELADLAKAMHPAQSTLQRGKPLFRFKLEPGEGMLWCPEPHIVVLLLRLDALKTTDLEAIPLSPRKGPDAPPGALRNILGQGRVLKQSLAWAAGNLQQPNLIKDMLAFAPWPTDNLQILANIQAFGLSLVSQDGLAVDGYFRGSDENGALILQKQLEGLNFKNLKSYKLQAPPPNPSEGDARWISLQIRGDAQAIRAALGQGN